MNNTRLYGCFGYVTTFNESGESCGVCPARKACKKQAYQSLKAMSSELDVTGLVGRFGEAAITDAAPLNKGERKPVSRRQRLKQYAQSKTTAMLVMNLPKKERQVIASIHKKGIPVRALVRGGVNPFEDSRPEFLKVPCRMVIEQESFTRAELKRALMMYFPHWRESTAESHASIAVRVLCALKVIQKDGNSYTRVN